MKLQSIKHATAFRDVWSPTLPRSIGWLVLITNDGQHAINFATTCHGTIDLCLPDVITLK